MHSIAPYYQWLVAHWPAAWLLISPVLVALVRTHTADEWLALGQSNPRLQGAIKIASALGIDPRKLVQGLVQLVLAKSPPIPRASAAPTDPPVQP